MKRNRVLIIGGVAAGPSAAAKAKRLDPNLDITIFEQGEFISYGTCSMPYYVGHVIENHQDLIVHTPASFQREKQCAVRILHRVEEINPHRKYIIVRDLEKDQVQEYRYDRLVLATGAKSRLPDPAWLKFRNVFTIKNLRDSMRLKEYIHQRRPFKAVILGGGFIGMEMAEAFSNQRLDVTVVHKDSLPMSTLEPESQKIVMDDIHRHGVRFVGNAAVRSIEGQDGLASKIVTSAGDVDADLVLLALGFEPNADLAKAARIRCGSMGGVLVDHRCRTSVDGIFAAGACTEMRNAVTGRPMVLPLASIANRMGRVVGQNLAGVGAEFPPVVKTTAVKVYKLEVAAAGLGSTEATNCGFSVETVSVHAPSRSKSYPGSKEIFVKFIVDARTGRLLGANVIGEEGAALRINTLGMAIHHRMTVDQLEHMDMMYTPPFAPVWDPLLIAASESRKNL